MTIQFPNNAAVDQTYDYNGLTYIYDGEKWTASGAAAFEDAYVNVTGDTMTGDLTVPSLNGGPLAGFRNQIINGSFNIWQRTTDKTANGYGTADRWYQYGASSNNTDLGTRVARDVGISGVSAYSARVIKSTANGVSSLSQGIELVRVGDAGIFAIGTQWTLSYYSTSPVPQFNIVFTDNVDGSGATGGVSGDPGEVEIEDLGNGWKRYARTVTITGAPGANSTNLRIQLAYNNPVDAKITAIQFEPGPVATPFEHRPIGTELALCQRYYLEIGTVEQVASYRPPNRGPMFFFPVTMRAAPSMPAASIYRWKGIGSSSDYQDYTAAGRGVIRNTLGFALTQDWSNPPIMLEVEGLWADAEL